MKVFKKFKSYNFLLIILIFFSIFLRFYNLNWGAPFYFHPDERNIASSVAQLNLPTQMNPHFFAYGSLPVYTIYFTGLFINSLTHVANTTFEQAIVISRFYSALFSLLLIPLLFQIGKKLKDEKTGLFAAFLAATSVGFTQFAHFGTFEMWLTLFGLLLFWLCLQKNTLQNVLLMGVVFGILVATKVSSLILFPLPIVAIFMQGRTHTKKSHLYVIKTLKNSLIFLLIAASVYTITNPFVFWDQNSFQSSMRYESGVALGTLPVFYTGEFYATIPGVFQLFFIYPFLLNPLITIIFIPSFFYCLYTLFKTKKSNLLLLISYFLFLFLSQIFLFVKWTRYMMPTLPFIYLITSIALSDFLYASKKKTKTNYFLVSAIIIVCITFIVSYFITAFIRTDTRIAAKQFVQKTIPPNASVLSEVYDLGILPFNSTSEKIDLFNFYDLDPTNPIVSSNLKTQLTSAEYIILPSQRILKIRLNNPEKFPNGYSFYNSLTTDTLGYEKIYQTPCDIFCKITYLGDPVFRYEETANVFDRPTLYIFKKK